jgi:hypothetical protein
MLIGLAAAAILIPLASAPGRAQAQRLANPSYFYPGATWTTLEAAAPTVALAIINPNSGPGAKLNTDYVAQVKEAKAHGIKVIGYVDTAYGKRSKDLVNADVDKFYKWYHVDGIFFDEASNLAPDLPYYKGCYNFVHSTYPKAIVVLNPGAPTLEGYMKASDVIVTFESPYSSYETKFVDTPWATKYPARRFWHIVLGATTEAEMQNAVKLSKARHAGWVYVTPYAPPANPYDKLPNEPYFSDELNALASIH